MAAPKVTKSGDALIGRTVRSKSSHVVGKVIERLDHEPQYRVTYTDDQGNKAEAVFEASDVEKV